MLLAAVVALALCLSGCDSGGEMWNGYSKESFYFDTICEITIYSLEEGIVEDDSEEAFNDAANLVITDTFKLMSEYENTLSRTVEGSDVDRINKAGGKSTAAGNGQGCGIFHIARHGLQLHLHEGIAHHRSADIRKLSLPQL